MCGEKCTPAQRISEYLFNTSFPNLLNLVSVSIEFLLAILLSVYGPIRLDWEVFVIHTFYHMHVRCSNRESRDVEDNWCLALLGFEPGTFCCRIYHSHQQSRECEKHFKMKLTSITSQFDLISGTKKEPKNLACWKLPNFHRHFWRMISRRS